eukprot:TRINITY_DN26178_c0_g1_i1.p1 TRINITY_DN26178_c0_g1~~TRINITY_DN26178_c0_g1_i1.p1  ORF type:complete len:111 (-),score=21.41 TRINITY_DN26178_c0_g1_i1:33-365(-)
MLGKATTEKKISAVGSAFGAFGGSPFGAFGAIAKKREVKERSYDSLLEVSSANNSVDEAPQRQSGYPSGLSVLTAKREAKSRCRAPFCSPRSGDSQGAESGSAESVSPGT